MSCRGVLLDRDGVLTPDLDRFTPPGELQPLPGVRDALLALRDAGWRLAVVTNQPWVGRGVCTLADVAAVNLSLNLPIERWYCCPHHPHATLPEWRSVCACRKPRPGMLLQAAAELELDLSRSYMIGDRITDMEAGARAGCRTIRVTSSVSDSKRIISPDAPVPVSPVFTVPDLPSAAYKILHDM